MVSNSKRLRKPRVTRAAIREMILELENVKAHGKERYQKADELQAELIKLMGVEKTIKLDDGRTARIKNNFIDKDGKPKNVSFRPCGVKLHELTISKK